MAFYESPRFPDYLAYGLLVGPMYASNLVRVNSGAESRNQIWDAELHVFDGSTTHRTQAERDEINSFFRTMKGRIHGFRVKDYSDFTDGGAGFLSAIAGSPGGTYQLVKRYTSGAQTDDRDISKPIDPIVVAGGGSYTVDYTTGIVTHVSGAAPTGWTGSFDVPVRFDHDELRWQIAASAGGGFMYIAEQLRMVEIRI